MNMQAPSEAELLVLWECGLVRHPIDRALLLVGWARPELSPARLPQLPLGALNAALLRLRESCFGPHISTCVDCERCGERLELALDTGQLLANSGDADIPAEFEISNLRFRVPCSCDLAAVAGDLDIQAAAMKLLERCCLERPDNTDERFASILAEAEAAMEALDPAADINLALACENCGHRWLAGFDIGAFLWNEIDAHVRSILAEVHSLARAYGWTESEILALTPQRRTAYLHMVGV